jgi:hypothetical protein
MRFTAGENLFFGMFAQAVDFGLGDEVLREDDLGLRSTLNGIGYEPLSIRSNPLLFSLQWRTLSCRSCP